MAVEWMSLLYLVLFAMLVFPAVVATNRRSTVALRNVAIWLAILAALVAGYMAFGR